MKELNCINCGAIVSFNANAACEYCNTPVELTPEMKKQFEGEKREFERAEKKKIDAHVQSTFNFIPEKRQIGAVRFFSKWALFGSLIGWFMILFLFPLFILISEVFAMLLFVLLFFYPLALIIYLIILLITVKNAGISNFKTFWKYPKINPQLGYEVIGHTQTGKVSYETALRALLVANIPFHIAVTALLLEGLEVDIIAVRFRLGRPLY